MLVPTHRSPARPFSAYNACRAAAGVCSGNTEGEDGFGLQGMGSGERGAEAHAAGPARALEQLCSQAGRQARHAHTAAGLAGRGTR